MITVGTGANARGMQKLLHLLTNGWEIVHVNVRRNKYHTVHVVLHTTKDNPSNPGWTRISL